MRDPGLRNQQRTELQVGALLLASLIALVVGVIWISGARPGEARMALFATAPEAGALAEGSRVTLLGVDVGSVESIRLRPEGVVLGLEVRYRGALPVDTRGEIRAAGFLGQAALALVPGASDRVLSTGDTIRAASAPGLQDLAGTLGEDASRVLSQVRRILDDTTVANVRRGAGFLAGGMEELETLLKTESESLERMIEGLSATSARLAELTGGPELDRTVARLDSLTGTLVGASDDLDRTAESLASVLGKIDGGEGSLGLMVNDTTLYVRLNGALENLQAATEEIALLTRDVRERPEHYTRGLKFSVF
jgi:phospholipid/cholesterol/gamma-HCH transport system substrate-binding protein